jgi:hypothetical protein
MRFRKIQTNSEFWCVLASAYMGETSSIRDSFTLLGVLENYRQRVKTKLWPFWRPIYSWTRAFRHGADILLIAVFKLVSKMHLPLLLFLLWYLHQVHNL